MQPFGQTQLVPNRGYGGYNTYSHVGYPPQQYHAPTHYPQGGYYHSYPQGAYNPVHFQGFQNTVLGHMGRGRAPYNGGRGGGGYGRGAYVGGTTGDRGRGGFGLRARKKKPFVGGSLETQRRWEKETTCCFFLQKNCKFYDACRFLHEDDGRRPCQYGEHCRVGHADRVKQADGTAEADRHSSHSVDGRDQADGKHDVAAESP
ncbi:zinc finger protein family member, putative [Trypanosoma equiperdum]|uniref:C3H1-type domain-containing protein n=4 Tax=Trypanozoon TaxID=39700 RepID=Q389B0_TRYB2|nr:hypothetical protein, conserved [Trypanosoma brucei gambiense DAL972]XP_823438.1 hypothetical protein, conserved [Trypanosoma brucei brucei TREU927]RHW69229.1 zinc finger protein family member [Trypanosoma brucei equiperdum]SCU65040.1 zinc finger protein family member, putative [Trypanosoma equiperdum]EAN78610.1 hypothetical protein, conserved [Trypanosoma brucei brucei TREU927]CBH16387.1 hypothetical protein, conserved [Trypanosoma brucei gambiense DAL972]|eukprot:XP_011778651.1 hypothetical protein, conserved [Trypanosoma brucei gambiense DAL972]